MKIKRSVSNIRPIEITDLPQQDVPSVEKIITLYEEIDKFSTNIMINSNRYSKSGNVTRIVEETRKAIKHELLVDNKSDIKKLYLQQLEEKLIIKEFILRKNYLLNTHNNIITDFKKISLYDFLFSNITIDTKHITLEEFQQYLKDTIEYAEKHGIVKTDHKELILNQEINKLMILKDLYQIISKINAIESQFTIQNNLFKKSKKSNSALENLLIKKGFYKFEIKKIDTLIHAFGKNLKKYLRIYKAKSDKLYRDIKKYNIDK